jgi:restriction system protein
MRCSPDQPDDSDPSDSLLPPHGGYDALRSFHVAECLYDGTVVFCDRFIPRNSRTHDQMVQAARSGARNISEGSEASGTSKKTELKLMHVSKSSLEELLLDYASFLRQRRLPIWPKDSPQALAVRNKYKSDSSDPSDLSAPLDPHGIARATPVVAANTLQCLCHQATHLIPIRAAARSNILVRACPIWADLGSKRVTGG